MLFRLYYTLRKGHSHGLILRPLVIIVEAQTPILYNVKNKSDYGIHFFFPKNINFFFQTELRHTICIYTCPDFSLFNRGWPMTQLHSCASIVSLFNSQ